MNEEDLDLEVSTSTATIICELILVLEQRRRKSYFRELTRNHGVDRIGKASRLETRGKKDKLGLCDGW